MKHCLKVMISVLLLAALITSFQYPITASAAETTAPKVQGQIGEFRAVWFSFKDWQTYLKGKNKDDFTTAFTAVCDKTKACGCNAIIVHVRSHNDAVYPSAIYPWSTMMLNGNPGYDPLAIMVQVAHAKGLQIHAWINPYGYRNGVYAGNPAIATQANIVAGVTEIVNTYNVDGIHFDDYFPPLGVQVHNSMIAAVYKAAHAKGKIFGVSPQGNITNNINNGVDIVSWLSKPGYIDYVCPQIYWTNNYSSTGTTQLYNQRLAQWKALDTAGIPMYVGLALYRAGQPSTSDPGWGLKNTNIIEQLQVARSLGCSGYMLYCYSSLNNAPAQTELYNLIAGE